MRLEDIGFYTLSEQRCKTSYKTSPLSRCEIVLTGRCNLRCPYCRGLPKELSGDLEYFSVVNLIKLWAKDGLQNIRFSGGEPTIHPYLEDFVKISKNGGIKRIAISTNGTCSIEKYLKLIDLGVNDFSISLDAGCCSVGDQMSGVNGAWKLAVSAIKELSKQTYVTVGVVFTEINAPKALDTILFIDGLGPSDIRVIPSAQWNRAIKGLVNLPKEILNKYPILKYRIENMVKGRSIRGVGKSKKCPIALDDVAVAGNYHFPCIIYLREQGKPIGTVGENMRNERYEWFLKHNTHEDKICKENCIDCVADFNDKWEKFHERF